MSGIARIAAQSSPAGEGHLIEFRALEVRSILNKSVSNRRLNFAWSINPYRGCEFACKYCYARYTHEFMELRDPVDFERKIFIKQNAAWLLEQELRKLSRSTPGRARDVEEIAIGTATDPYQPVERQARVTQSLLEVFARHRGLRIGIVTKSTLIERDIPLLRRIAEHNELVLHLTITTPDARLARLLEPRAPRPDLRFRTVARLRQAGLRAGILCSPLLPGITDTLASLDAMAARARRVDASFMAAEPLFLKPCSKATYLSFIGRHFPKLEPMYREKFEGVAFVPAAYRDRMQALVRAVVRKHGLHHRITDALLTRDVAASIPDAGTTDSGATGSGSAQAQPAQASLFPCAVQRSQPASKPNPASAREPGKKASARSTPAPKQCTEQVASSAWNPFIRDWPNAL